MEKLPEANHIGSRPVYPEVRGRRASREVRLASGLTPTVESKSKKSGRDDSIADRHRPVKQWAASQ